MLLLNLRLKSDRMQTCTSCKDTKPLTEFYRKATGNAVKDTFCKICCGMRDRRKAHWPLLSVDAVRKIYNQMFESQAGCCAICLRHQSEFKKGFAVDHDHTTGRVRGLLCINCNKGLGNFYDNLDKLEAAKRYLKYFNMVAVLDTAAAPATPSED